MTDIRSMPDKHLAFWFVPSGGLAVENAPTAAELNNAVVLSQAIAWDASSVNPEDSSDIDDAAITDSATAVEAGFDQYGATLNLFYPKDLSLVGDPYVIAYNTFKVGRVEGYIVRRLKPADPNTDTALDLAAAGDWVEVFKVQADYSAQDTEGETSTKYTVAFLPQGFMSGPTMVKLASAVTVTPATLSATVGDKKVLKAALGGYNITADAKWSSSDPTKATVSGNGVVTVLGTGSVTITAEHQSATGSGSSTLTLS